MNTVFNFIENHADAITAMATFFGAVIALITVFIPYIYKKMTLPKLVVSTSVNDEALFTQINGNDFSLKLDISNIGKSNAEQVQLTLNKIIFENQELSVEPLKLFWSYQDAKSSTRQPLETQTSIQSGSHSHCDFIFFIQTAACSKYNAYIASQVMQFNELKNNGHYKIELAVGAKDIKTTFWEIEFTINFDSTDKDKIIPNIHCKKKRGFCMKNIVKNILNCLIMILTIVVFLFGVKKNIEELSNLKFFIISFAYFIVCFSLKRAILCFFDKNEGEI